MKRNLNIVLIVALSVVIILACNREGKGTFGKRIQDIESRLDALEGVKPTLSQSMNLIQIQHTKLYFSIKNQNRDLAAYLLHELDENFEFVVENHGMHNGKNLAELTVSGTEPIIDDFADKVQAANPEELMQTFELLTVECNNCHFSTGHPFIKIIAPEGEMYLNQDFTAN